RDSIVISDWKGRNLSNAEADQESRLRPDGDEALGRARPRHRLQRKGYCGALQHSARGTGEDSAAAGESWGVDFAARHERGIYPGPSAGNDLGFRRDSRD